MFRSTPIKLFVKILLFSGMAMSNMKLITPTQTNTAPSPSVTQKTVALLRAGQQKVEQALDAGFNKVAHSQAWTNLCKGMATYATKVIKESNYPPSIDGVTMNTHDDVIHDQPITDSPNHSSSTNRLAYCCFLGLMLYAEVLKL